MISNNNNKQEGILSTVLLGALIRLFIVVYTSFHESIRQQQLTITDIDYKVYTDAMITPECSSPYTCHHTYRYSPFLAYFMAFNSVYEPAGKLFFILFDVVAMLGLSSLIKPHNRLAIVRLYAYNPLFIYLTARGSCESISMALMFWTWSFIFGINGNSILSHPSNSRVTQETRPYRLMGYCLYGLWVHFRVYPIIFLPIILIHQYQLTLKSKKSFFQSFLMVSLCSGGVFLALFAYFYHLYGQAFVEQTYLYHLRRLDNRHSFSPIFYQIYLNLNSSSLIRSLAQICVLVTVSRRVHSTISPAYAVFLGTYAFVNFNKVITLQYYMWIWGALLMVLPESSLLTNSNRRLQKSFNYTIQWVLGVAIWVWMSLRLEGDGDNIFKGMWMICIGKLFLDMWVLYGFMKTIRNVLPYSAIPQKQTD